MSFEEKLRSEIQREAGAVPLPDRSPERAARRARQRRNHRRAAVATVAVTAVLAVALPPALSSDGGEDDVKIQPAREGIPATGPLDIAWRQAAGGLSNVMPVVQDGGVVYALSSGPGTRMADFPMGDYPVALYKLADDGTWTPVELEGPRARDIAAADGLLYSIATAPGTGGEIGVQLSTSEDGGATWAPEDVALPDPPTDDLEWVSESKLELESDGEATVAVVVTSFTPDYPSIFPQMADDPSLYVEARDDGFALVRADTSAFESRRQDELAATAAQSDGRITSPASPPSTEPPAAGPPATSAPTTTRPDAPTTTGPAGPTTTAPPATAAPTTATTEAPTTTTTAPPATLPATSTTADGSSSPPTTEPSIEVPTDVVDSVTWDELGLDGPESLGPVYQVLRRTDDGWEALDGAGDAFDGLSGVELDVAEGRFVAAAWDHGDQVVLTSDDGTAWSRVAGPGDGSILGMGPALVELPVNGAAGHVSTDGGATWQELDLAGAGVGASSIYAADAGPLGLALVLNDPGGLAPAKLAVTGDLVDWTVTPLTDVVGPDPVGMASVFVGEDRVVVTTVGPPPASGETPPSRTAVGVPHRG
jgi:hypothetical protein